MSYVEEYHRIKAEAGPWAEEQWKDGTADSDRVKSSEAAYTIGGLCSLCFQADRELAALKADHARFLRKLLDACNCHPDDATDGDMVDEVKRLINEKGVTL